MTNYQQNNEQADTNSEETNDQSQDTEQQTVQMKNQPKLILSNYSVSPETVEAGSDLSLIHI